MKEEKNERDSLLLSSTYKYVQIIEIIEFETKLLGAAAAGWNGIERDRGRCTGTKSPFSGARFVDEEDETNVGSDVDHVRRKALVKTADAFVPPRLSNYVHNTGVVSILILKSGSNHLVWIRGRCGKQLRESGKAQVPHSGL